MKNQLEFYREIHANELLRKNEIDASIGFPTTLLTLLIGGGFFIFKDENFHPHYTDNEIILIVITVCTILFILTILIAMTFLIRMYLNRFRKYKYLPCSLDLINREDELFKHYLAFFKNNGDKKAKKKAISYATAAFEKDLLKYYVEFATDNQLVNDGRIKDYYWSRKILIGSIVLITIIGILILIK
ncbi:hypothetical protein [Aequorivita viscosa]|uniref:Uncharacterized protein n=1 Tax=Aequorivita viscosa TaxID=797419 RepID=A0A1M6M3P3_9FLAO|nr:hypothetical protein [Aequorivita viscosa]SDX30828.1 hypothetical protein SAMN05216556_12417 [Aequorivita viscosa]SHJ78059.1 hypothetical protein SAMN04487908_12543 [Aequorivita viscosa]